MRRFRFNIASLLAVVLLLAVGIAALRESNEIWDSCLFSLALGVLLVSIPFAVHRTESRRAFWIGFALFGWSYLGLSLVPSIESRLITTQALAYFDSKVPWRSLGVTFRLSRTSSAVPNKQVQNAFHNSDATLHFSSSQRLMIWDATSGKLLGGWIGTTENFVRIGHSLFALLAGWFGGQLSRRLCRTSRAQEPSAAVNVEGTTQ